jgi:hypothetical protein
MLISSGVNLAHPRSMTGKEVSYRQTYHGEDQAFHQISPWGWR